MWACSGRIDCIHFMELICYNTSRFFIVYTFLETLLYTDNDVTVCINAMMIGNLLIILYFLNLNCFIININSIVLAWFVIVFDEHNTVNAPWAPPSGEYRRYKKLHYYYYYYVYREKVLYLAATFC